MVEPSALTAVALEGREVGGLVLEALLAEAPGAWLYRARSEDGERALVQLVPLRRLRAEDAADRRDLVRRLAQESARLAREGAYGLDAYALERLGDGLELYRWRLRWREAAQAPSELGAVAELGDALDRLLSHVAQRHALGGVNPLLDARLIGAGPQGPEILGVPLTVPAHLRHRSVRAARVAPEEEPTGERTPSGDLWRLGQALKTLTAGRPDAPAGLEGWLARLAEPDPARRFATAEAAQDALRALDFPPAPPEPELDPDLRSTLVGDRTLTADEMRAAFPPPEATDPIAPHPASPWTSPPEPEPERRTPPPTPDEEAEATTPRPEVEETESPTLWMSRDALEEARRAEPAADGLGLDAAATVQGLPVPPELARLRRREAPAASEGATRVFEDPARSPTEVGRKPPTGAPAPPETLDERFGPGGTLAQPRPPVGGHLDADRFGPGQTLAQVRPPIGGRLGDERFGPGGTLAEPHPGFGGERRLLPGSDPAAERRLPPPAAFPSELGDETSSRGEPSDPRPPPEPSGGMSRVGITVGALAVLAVLMGVAVQLLEPPPEPTLDETSLAEVTPLTERPASVVGAFDEVDLRVTPDDAEVVGELDGRSLGQGRTRLLVPAGDEHAVLIAAPGYEPTRLILPRRGRIAVELQPNQDILPCPVEVFAPGAEPLRGVGLGAAPEATDDRSGSPPRGRSGASKTNRVELRIRGAAVLRSVEGHGAWLVRCATFGGTRRHRLASRTRGRQLSLSVTQPAEAAIAVNGEPVGTAPVRVEIPSGYALVEARDAQSTTARWIPLTRDATVELPRPVGTRPPLNRR